MKLVDTIASAVGSVQAQGAHGQTVPVRQWVGAARQRGLPLGAAVAGIGEPVRDVAGARAERLRGMPEPVTPNSLTSNLDTYRVRSI